MDNLILYLFNGGNFIVIDSDSSDSDSDIVNNMLIPGENLEHMLIQDQNLPIDFHNYTVLNEILDIEENECVRVAAAIKRDLQIFQFKIYLNDNV